MSTKVQFRRGNTSQTTAFTGAVAEITVDTDKNVVVVHDGVTSGGHSLATEVALQAAFNKANAAYDSANADLSLIAGELASNVEFIAAVNASQNTSIGLLETVNATQNTTISILQQVDTTQNTNISAASTLAQAAFDSANNVAPQIAPSFAHANAAYDQANTVTVLAQAAFDHSNNTLIYAQAGYNQANTVGSDLSTANTFLQANDAITLTASKSYTDAANTWLKGYTDTSVANLVDSAPSTLDTLNELAAALGDDANFATTTASLIGVTRDHANAAFDSSNTKFSSSGGTVTGNVVVTGSLTSNSVVSNTYISVPYAIMTTSLSFANTASSNSLIDHFDSTIFRGAKYNIQITSDSGYQVSDLMLLQYGTSNVIISEYGLLCSNTSTANGTLGTFYANLESGIVNLNFEPIAANNVLVVYKVGLANTGVAGVGGTGTTLPPDLASGSGTIDLSTGSGIIDLN